MFKILKTLVIRFYNVIGVDLEDCKRQGKANVEAIMKLVRK